MVLDNINCSEVIHNKLKKCEFCGKELAPIGLDYLYVMQLNTKDVIVIKHKSIGRK